jgi:hypothetical protein
MVASGDPSAHVHNGVVQQRLSRIENSMDRHQHPMDIQSHLLYCPRVRSPFWTQQDLPTSAGTLYPIPIIKSRLLFMPDLLVLVLDRQELFCRTRLRRVLLDVGFIPLLHGPIHPTVLLGPREHHNRR